MEDGGIELKINGIELKILRNNAHFQFNTEVADLLVLLKSGFQMDVYTLEAIDKHKNMLLLEDAALKKIVKSPLTEKIHRLDAARDAHYAALRAMAKSQCLDEAKDIADAALRINVVLDTYGNIPQMPLNEQTSAVVNLLQELNGAEYAADVQKIGVKDWVIGLANRNAALETLVKERYDKEASKTHIVLRQARSDVDTAYRKIVKRIDALIELQTPKPYEKFVNTLNEVIAKYKVKHHHRRKESEENEE